MGLREMFFCIGVVVGLGIDLLIATNDIRKSIKESKEISKKNEEIKESEE